MHRHRISLPRKEFTRKNTLAIASPPCQVPTPIRVGAGGRFVSTETGQDVVLRGTNWFGWNVNQYNLDGMWVSDCNVCV